MYISYLTFSFKNINSYSSLLSISSYFGLVLNDMKSKNEYKKSYIFLIKNILIIYTYSLNCYLNNQLNPVCFFTLFKGIES